MRGTVIILLIVFSLAIFACSGNKAAELFDTAKFEELQNNKEHAIQLYEEIVKSYPDSDYAKRAKERLAQLKGVQK